MTSHPEGLSTLDAHAIQVLRGHRESLLQSWRERVLATFPAEAVHFLRTEADPFRNPLGERIRHSTERLLAVLLGDEPLATCTDALDAFVRARALQGQGASATVGFVFELKRIVHASMGSNLTLAQMSAIDDRIDAVALAAFEVYVRCRDEVNEIRLRAERRRVATLIRRFGPVEEPEAIVSEVQG